MKIKWIGKRRLVPKVGILQKGNVRNVPDDTARALIKQGLAEPVTYSKKKSKTKDKGVI